MNEYKDNTGEMPNLQPTDMIEIKRRFGTWDRMKFKVVGYPAAWLLLDGGDDIVQYKTDK